MNRVKKFVAGSTLIAGVTGAIYWDEMIGVSEQEANKIHKIISSEDVKTFQNLVAKDVAGRLCHKGPEIVLDMPNPFNSDVHGRLPGLGISMFDIDITFGEGYNGSDIAIPNDTPSHITRDDSYNEGFYTSGQIQSGDRDRDIQQAKDTFYYEDKVSEEILEFANQYDTEIYDKIMKLLHIDGEFCNTDFNELFKKKTDKQASEQIKKYQEELEKLKKS